MQQTKSQPRSRRLQAVYIGIALFAVGVAVGLLDEAWLARFATERPWIVIAGCLMLTGFAIAGSAAYMRGIDELAQRAHYIAWYWGGSVGLTLLLFLLVAWPALAQVVDIEALTAPLSRLYGEPGGEFLGGVVASIVALTLGYSGWWVVYWLRKN